jgi:hypothetical protein
VEWVPYVAAVNGAWPLLLAGWCEVRVLQCPSKRGMSSLCCPRAFSVCWVGEVSTQYLISIKCVSRCLAVCLLVS